MPADHAPLAADPAWKSPRLAPIPALAPGARLPTFFVIGAAKAGTTSLYAYLRRHPGVCMSTFKEPSFFSNSAVWWQGMSAYTEMFASARHDQICGEASPTYTWWPHSMDSAELISHLVPEARFIYLVRDPVERMWSHYLMRRRLGATGSFEQVVADAPQLFDASRYLMQIDRYLRHFDRERLLVLRHEHLRDQPALALSRVQQHLGLPEVDLTSDGELRTNVSGREVHVRQRTTMRWRQLPGAQAIADALPRRYREAAFRVVMWSPLGRRWGREATPEPMREDTRRELTRIFAPEVVALEEFLGEDLSSWPTYPGALPVAGTG